MPKVVTQRCLEQDLNLQPTDRKPKCLTRCTTAPPRRSTTTTTKITVTPFKPASTRWRELVAHLFESLRVFARRLVDDLGDDVDRRQHDADRRVDGRPLGVVSVAAARVDRRDAVSEHRNVLQTAHVLDARRLDRRHPTIPLMPSRHITYSAVNVTRQRHRAVFSQSPSSKSASVKL